MISFKVQKKFPKTEQFFERLLEVFGKGKLNEYGKIGVEALREATPKLTGKTSESWEYGIDHKRGKFILYWYNTNVVDGTRVAVVLQYGHMSPRGYWIEGRDYINPAMETVFNAIAEDMWKEVVKLERNGRK